MTIRFWLLTAVSALTVAACIAIPFIPETVQPIDATTIGGPNPVMEVLPSTEGVPMPAGLHEGDKVYISDMSPATRSFFMVNTSNPPRGTSIDLAVKNPDGSVHHVQAEFVPVNFLNGDALNMATEIVGYALDLLMAALGLLLLWRGQNRAAAGVALWCFSNFLQAFFALNTLPVPYGNILNWCTTTLATMGTVVGLYLIADGLTYGARTAKQRRASHWRFGAVVGLYAISVTAFDLRYYLHGDFRLFDSPYLGITEVSGLHFAALFIPLAVMAYSYRRCDAVNQARIRWVVFSLSGLLISYLVKLFTVELGLPIFVLNLLDTAIIATTFLGFAYAVLKHQLVSLQVVLNRALVYGLVTSLVVGVFAAMLSFLEHETLNTETNRLLALFVPLILGMGLDTIKRQVNGYIGKAFFRRRHQAQAALAQFARTCGHVDHPEELLDLTADELYSQAGPECLGIYLTSPQSAGASITRQRGDIPCPPKLENNDLTFLRLKAGDAEVNLTDVRSKLGQDGLVYALHVRAQLLGCIYIGPRPAEAYSAEERQLFERVAHQVAVALHALRLEAQRTLLEELAGRKFSDLSAAEIKAKELIEGTA